MQGLAVGAIIFAAGLAVQMFGVLRTSIGRADVPVAKNDAALDLAPPVPPLALAWTGPIAVIVLVVAMSGATIGAFELMRSLPVIAAGGHSGH